MVYPFCTSLVLFSVCSLHFYYFDVFTKGKLYDAEFHLIVYKPTHPLGQH